MTGGLLGLCVSELNPVADAWCILLRKLCMVSVTFITLNSYHFLIIFSTDADQEHQYIMDRALRSYKEHREQEMRQGSGGRAWPQQPAGGSAVTSSPQCGVQQRTSGGPATDHPSTDGRPAGSSSTPAGDIAINRLLSKRPRAKSAFSSLRGHSETVTKKELTLGRNNPIRVPQSRTAAAAHAGPRPLGSTPSIIRADSPLGSELSLHMAPPPCPSPCSSRSDSPIHTQGESGSVSDEISKVGLANILQEDGMLGQGVVNNVEGSQEECSVPLGPIPHQTLQVEDTQVNDNVQEQVDR